MRIELGFRGLVFQIVDPVHEISDRAQRSIAIEHFKDQAASGKVARNAGQRIGRCPGEQTTRRFIAFDWSPDKIVRSCITHIDDKTRNKGSSIDKCRWATGCAGWPSNHKLRA